MDGECFDCTAQLDAADYPIGIKVSDKEMKELQSSVAPGTATGNIASTRGATRPNRTDLNYDEPLSTAAVNSFVSLDSSASSCIFRLPYLATTIPCQAFCLSYLVTNR